jgi:signal transduction histidine kinase/CheY-like chemotaxis protein/chemotaxis methyl-accepting protein methylase
VIRRDAQMVRLAAFDPDQSSGGAAQFTCSVLIVGSNAAELVDDLLADLSKIRHRQADSGPILLWQVEPSDGRLELLGPAEDGTAEDDQMLALSRRGFVDIPDKSTLAPGAMYFVPPHRRIWFEGQVVRIGQRSPGEDRPIDRLLLSLAEGWGHHSVLVFALQSTADGECGLRIIRAVGGIALQPEYPSAKRLRPQDFRSDLKSDPRPDGADANERASISERTPCSEFPIASEDRRRNALRMARVFSVPAHLRTSAQRACEVAVQQARERGRLRAWMPACKAGGMTYAVAMLLAQAAERIEDPPKMVIFGTDDDELALSVARAGRFSARAALGMDPELRGRYTFDEGEVIRVREALRESCVFSRHELLRDPPMARMALVVCHRVFEGVSSARRSQLVEGFHYSLRHGGILLALDHVDLFPDQLFERIDAGFFRVRPAGRRMPLTRRFHARLESASTALAERPPAPQPESPLWGPAKTSPEPILPSRAERLPVGAAATALEPVLQSIVLPLLVCDAELRVSFFNLEAENAFHLSPADAGGTLLALAPRLPGGIELVDVARGAASAASPRELSARSGRRLYRVRIAVLMGQSGRGFSIAFNDVTELEAARADVGRKAAELEALYSTLPVGVSIHDRQGRVRHDNRHLSLRGAPSASGSDPLERLYAEEVPRWIARVLESGEPIHDVELFVAEGERRLSWLCNFAPIRDAAGTVHGASAVVQDITPLKRVEATLREADQQKDDFLAMLGHELRNPMAAIRNATELLSRIDQPTPQLMRLQSIFDRQTLQTTKLIDGLLDVARVARGKVELELAPVPVVDLVRQVVDDRRQQFERRELELHFPEHEVWVNADRVRLVQILDNLISNALKFTVATGHISVEVRTQGERGSICIGDDGAGIEPELLPRIFEPFRQGQVTMARTQGLGLGLALAKGLVDLHGFQLAARSAGPGRGACFEVEFPLTPAEERRAPESRISSRPLDLLLVEDNVDIAETLAELLGAAGHHIEVEGSAEDALESLRRRRPDVMLCDIGLPGMDGLELATRLRADPAFSDLKLVAMTGFGDSSSEERIRRAGFDRYLVKPVQLEALRECLLGVASVASSRAHRRG